MSEVVESVEDRPATPTPPTWIELQSNIGLEKAGKITGLSVESLERHFSKYIKQLTTRRRGMQLKHALGIANGTLKPVAEEEITSS